MKIIIAGMGKVGTTLVSSLVKEEHEITVIDSDESSVDKVVENHDCMGIVGNAAVQDVLLEAGVKDCDVLIACTDKDEVNMLTCLLAHKYSKCKKIARIREPEYYEQIKYLQEELNISSVINPEKTCATEMSRIMRHASTLSSESFIGGRITLQKVIIDENNILCNTKIKDVAKIIGSGVLFSIIERGEDVIVPKGYDMILPNDKVSFFADEKASMDFYKKAGFEYDRVNSIMIIGYSVITRYFIDMMLKIDPKCKIKIIEEDKKKCEEINENFPSVVVVNGSGVDKKLLLQEGLEDMDAFITLTGIDEENIILSLNAKKYIKGKIVTKINNLSLLEDLKELNMDSIINPEVIAANNISLAVRRMVNTKGSSMESLYRLCDDRVEVLQFLVKNENELLNIKFKDMHIKKNTLIACIYRLGKIIVPSGNDELHMGDRVIIVSKNNTINSLQEIIDNE